MSLRSIQFDIFDYLSYYAFYKKRGFLLWYENPAPLVHGSSSTGNKSFQHHVRFSDCFWFPIITHPSKKTLRSCHPEESHEYLWEDSDKNKGKRSIDGDAAWSMASLATHYTQPEKHCFRNLHRKGTNINCCARVMSDSNLRKWQGGLQII